MFLQLLVYNFRFCFLQLYRFIKTWSTKETLLPEVILKSRFFCALHADIFPVKLAKLFLNAFEVGNLKTYRADESQKGRDSCSRLLSCFINSSRVGVSQSLLFHVFFRAFFVCINVISFFRLIRSLVGSYVSSIVVCGPFLL